MKKIAEFGFSLLEVLVSMAIFSILFFAQDRLNLYSWCRTQQAVATSIAVQQLNNLYQRLFVLADHAGLDEQIVLWNRENAVVLPHGQGIVQGGFPRYQLTLCWGQRRPLLQRVATRRACLYQKVEF